MKSELVVNNGVVYHLGLKKNQLARNIILVGDPARAYKVAAYFDEIDHETSNREYVTLTGKFNGLPVSVVGTGIGTDNVEIALAEIYTLLEFNLDTCQKEKYSNFTNIIRVGTSGGAQDNIPSGTQCLASYALGLDNTGMYYNQEPADDMVTSIENEAYRLITDATPDGYRFKGKIHPYASKADSHLLEVLRTEAQKTRAAYAVGITVSAPGFYGPSGRIMEGLENSVPNIKSVLSEINIKQQRVLNFEMESSLLFHLAYQMGYRAATICPVISNPKTSADLFDYTKSIEQSISIALNALVAINRS